MYGVHWHRLMVLFVNRIGKHSSSYHIFRPPIAFIAWCGCVLYSSPFRFVMIFQSPNVLSRHYFEKFTMTLNENEQHEKVSKVNETKWERKGDREKNAAAKIMRNDSGHLKEVVV